MNNILIFIKFKNKYLVTDTDLKKIFLYVMRKCFDQFLPLFYKINILW